MTDRVKSGRLGWLIEAFKKPGNSHIVVMLLMGVLLISVLVYWGITGFAVREVVLHAGQKGGTYHPLALAIARLVELENPRIRVRVEVSEGSYENVKRVSQQREANSIGIVQNDVRIPESLNTEGGDLRSLLPLHQGVLHFLVSPDSSITSVSDLRGKIMAEGLPGSGSPPLVSALLNHYEILEGELERRPLTLKGACDSMREGEVDAIMMAMGLKSSEFEKLVSDVPLQFVGIGDQVGEGSEIEGFRLTYPFVQATTIPKYTYSVPKSGRMGVPDRGVPAVAVRAVLVAHRELPDRMANAIARTLVENKASLSISHPSAVQITETFDSTQLQFPIHRGAHRYFHRDDPGFLRRNAEMLGFLLSLLIALIGFLVSARKWLGQLRKNRIDAYYIELDSRLDLLHEEDLNSRALLALDEELRAMERKAISELATEKLEANESFRIFQSLLQETRDEIRHRLQ
ncbi:MAG: TAXI family TRAP transporter solute-binding subunit [Verrucomicrobiota bacterium]